MASFSREEGGDRREGESAILAPRTGLDADGRRCADPRQDVAGEDLDLVEPIREAHSEVEDQEVAADLLVALDAADDVVRGAGEDRPVQLLDRREFATFWLEPALLGVG